MILSAGRSKRVTRVAGAGCHSVGVAAAGWLEPGGECRCMRRAEIEEAPDDGKWGPLALSIVSSINDGAWAALAYSSLADER